MAKIDASLFDIGRLDRLAYMDTPVHRVDPRAKILTTLVFLVCVVSFGKYEVSALLPYALYLVVVVSVGQLPAGYLARKLLVVAPFALMVGVANPFMDRQAMLTLGGLEISGGWVSYLSIIVRFLLTVSAALVLIATTGFFGMCAALGRMGMPQAMTVQLLLVYRYLFVLVEEGARMVRARALRSFGKRGLGIRVYGSLLGNLLLRTVERARRVHHAMMARGFTGELIALSPGHFRGADALFVLGWSALFILFRLVNIPALLGGVLG